MFGACKEILFLMFDMAEEGVEKARIKAQQNRLKEIIRVDKKELDTVYAQIGRMDVSGVDDQRRDRLIAEVKRIEARILRAEIRLEMLQDAASVDECTKAFGEKLADTAQSVRRSASEKVKDIKKLATEKGDDLKDILKDASVDITAKAEDMSIRAKDKAAGISLKAKDKAAVIKDKLSEKAFDRTAEDLDADEAVVEQVDDILKQIENTLKSVDAGESSAEDDSELEEIGEEFKF